MNALEINLSLDQIEKHSKYTLKNLVDKQTDKKALEYLNDEKTKLKKVKTIIHKKLQMQPYLLPGQMTNSQKKFLFMLRTKLLMLNLTLKEVTTI